jgi:hypothetical protein
MRIAVFAPLRPRSGRVVEYSERLLPLLARVLEVGILVDGIEPESSTLRDCCRVHDLRAAHYRKVLWRYDLAVYQVEERRADAYMKEPIREWPGVVVLHEDERGGRADSLLPEHDLEGSLAVVATSATMEVRLRERLPYAFVSAIDPAAGDDALVAAHLRIFEAALERAGRWVEPLLETACAEIPGFLPGDPSAPWRAEVDELIALAKRRSGNS